MFPIFPNCTDNNQTVYANSTCQDVNGKYSDHCVQLGYSQTALAVMCGGEFSDNEHCGTFFEVHMPNGSPYNGEQNPPHTHTHTHPACALLPHAHSSPPASFHSRPVATISRSASGAPAR